MEEVEACVKETKELQLACTDDEILNTKCMTDPTMIMTMKFLGRLEFTTMLTMPRTVPFVTQQIIQLSLSKGMSPVSPIGFAYFGAYIAKLGDISYGYHCVKLALSLVDKVGSKESAAEILAVCAQVAPFVEPLQSASEYHMKGYAASMTTGDVSSAMVNSIQLESTNIYAGVNLQIVSGRIEKSIMLFKEQNHVVFTVQLQQMQRTVYGLIGSDEEPEHLSEEQNILASNKSVMRTYWYQKSLACFMFRCYDETRDYTENFFACSEDTWSNLMFVHSASVFYTGLISF
jgi:predicted ATPase